MWADTPRTPLKLVICLLICSLFCGSCFCQKLSALNIEKDGITVAGVSSGGAMAIQLHVAYSKTFIGVGAFAAPPYWCAMGTPLTWEETVQYCMTIPSLIDLSLLFAGTTNAYQLESIDDPKNLAKARVWLFTGEKDNVVVSGVVKKVKEYYENYISDPGSMIRYIHNESAEHAWITDNYGNVCDYKGTPYINNCKFDASEDLLLHLYNLSHLNSKSSSVNSSNMFAFDQDLYTPDSVPPSNLSMSSKGFVYIPSKCQAGQGCRLVVALHGCLQGADVIGKDFIMNNGLNQWAETNNIVVLYPQATISELVPYNPQGCWDWWSYTGVDYATQLGPQMITIANMVAALQGTTTTATNQMPLISS